MNAEISLKEILVQVKKLNKIEQTTLLKKISSMIKKEEKQPEPIKLKELAGLGSSIWHDVNIDHYIDEERKW